LGVRVLAVDTTTERGSVAVTEDDSIRGEVRLVSPEGHSRRLLPAVDFLLQSLGLRAADVDAFAVTTGPGSFTGLRVGLSTVQGLALGTGKPCVGVSALDVLAARNAGAAPAIVALMDAYRGEVYGALYDGEGGIQGRASVERPEALVARVAEVAAFVGDGAQRHRQLVLSLRPRAVFPARSLFLAGTLGRMAAPRLARGEGVPPAELRPLYLREPDIRRPSP
jgi:tRNA threonylcarbamoyladenosine biosynthesis protein TsaB